MKIITIDETTSIVVDNVAYLEMFKDPDETNSYIAVDTDGTSHFLTEEQYNDAKNYLSE